LRHFSRAQVKVLLFERFVADIRGALDEVTRFVDLGSPLDLTGLATHHHRGDAPRHPRLRLLQNRLLRRATAPRLMPDLPGGPPPALSSWGRAAVRLDDAFERLNRSDRPYPEMKPDTRAFLERLFARENAGLSELIELDVGAAWPYMKG
jgi:hypothetical protein